MRSFILSRLTPLILALLTFGFAQSLTAQDVSHTNSPQPANTPEAGGYQAATTTDSRSVVYSLQHAVPLNIVKLIEHYHIRNAEERVENKVAIAAPNHLFVTGNDSLHENVKKLIELVDTPGESEKSSATQNAQAEPATYEDKAFVVPESTSLDSSGHPVSPASRVIVIETSPEAKRSEVIRQIVQALEKSGQAIHARMEREGKRTDYLAIMSPHRDLPYDKTIRLVETLKSLGINRMMFEVNPDPSSKESSVVVQCPADVTWRRAHTITETLQKLGDFKVDVRVAANNDPVTSTIIAENPKAPVGVPQAPANRVEPRTDKSEKQPSNANESKPAGPTDRISLTIENARGSVDELRDHQKSLDLKTRELAAQLREPLSDSAMGDKLHRQLRIAVQEAFEARQKLQQAELAEFTRRLQSIQESIKMREKISQQIIDRRVAELLDPNLKWDTVETSRQATQPKIASDRTSEKSISSVSDM